MSRTLDIDSVLTKDHLACRIADFYIQWETFRRPKIQQWRELRDYIFATDTTTTTNKKLPWKNKTTLPKLTQIRDNLVANYKASLFPRRNWVYWEGDTSEDQNVDKVRAIENYMRYILGRPEFKKEMEKVILDYIDYGNCFVMPKWEDQRQEVGSEIKTGFVGPMPVRISPLDIVFNPAAPSFEQSPKIIRSLMTLGELKSNLAKYAPNDDTQTHEKLFNYLIGIRKEAWSHSGNWSEKDHYLKVDGFQGFVDYLKSDFAEVLTFYGDLYDAYNDKFYKNKIITIVDRHKLISIQDNPTAFGTFPIYHCGWRVRQDNLWAMGPLDNLVGLQYRVDHIENMKADLLDLTVLPPLKIKGFVQDFEWGPLARIQMQDPDSDVELLNPQNQGSQLANIEIQAILNIMEEMAGSPKEAMGFRTPGEKTAYEVQRLENAAARIFSAKVVQFEEQIEEPLLNAMLDLAQRFMNETTVRVFDDELRIYDFMQLTRSDISGTGRIRPIAARNFAERADKVQNLTNMYGSAIAQDPEIKAHLSSVKIARMLEDLLDLNDYEVVKPYVRLAEQVEAQKFQGTMMEQAQMEMGTPAGIAADDSDEVLPDVPPQGVPA